MGMPRLTFTSEDIDWWLDHLAEAPRGAKDERPLEPGTINSMLISLRHVFNQAEADGLAPVNSCVGV